MDTCDDCDMDITLNPVAQSTPSSHEWRGVCEGCGHTISHLVGFDRRLAPAASAAAARAA